MKEVEFGYKPPRQLDKNIWEIQGEWKNKFGRRMTIVRLNNGQLAIHNAIRLREQEMKWLSSLGEPAFIIGPNTFHCSDAGWMAKKFPAAALFVPKSKLKDLVSEGLHPKDVNAEFPSGISSELRCIPMLGSKVDEAAFLHIPSRTLILCDLAFNMTDIFSGLGRIFMKWNKVGGQFGPSRLTKLVFTKDRPSLLDSYAKILQEDFDRVIVNHGDVLETSGKEKLRAGVERIFGDRI